MIKRRSLRPALGCCLAGHAAVVVMAPLAFHTAAGLNGPHRLGLAVLLLETLYVLTAYTCMGLVFPPGAPGARAGLLLALPPLLYLPAAGIAGCDPLVLASAQPAVAGTAVLAWGIARMAARLSRRQDSAAAVAVLLAFVFGTSLLPASHILPLLPSFMLPGELLLASNPFVAVSSAAGYDLVRAGPLYEGLALSAYRFRYPSPFLATALLIALGLAMGHAHTLVRTIASRHRLFRTAAFPQEVSR